MQKHNWDLGKSHKVWELGSLRLESLFRVLDKAITNLLVQRIGSK